MNEILKTTNPVKISSSGTRTRERFYLAGLTGIIQKAPKKSDNPIEWEAFYHTVLGYVLTHIGYMLTKYDTKYCIKETKDSIDATFLEAIQNYKKES